MKYSNISGWKRRNSLPDLLESTIQISVYNRTFVLYYYAAFLSQQCCKTQGTFEQVLRSKSSRSIHSPLIFHVISLIVKKKYCKDTGRECRATCSTQEGGGGMRKTLTSRFVVPPLSLPSPLNPSSRFALWHPWNGDAWSIPMISYYYLVATYSYQLLTCLFCCILAVPSCFIQG